MKILEVQKIPNIVKSMAVAAPLIFATPLLKAQRQELKVDVFEKTQTSQNFEIPDSMLETSCVKVGDSYVYPAVVIDLSEGILYHYDLEGYLYNTFPVATGKSSTPTKPGLRIVTGIENYPYKNAPRATKRRQNPNDYGPHVVCLANVDTKTGKITGSDGQFIHGTNQPNSIGKKASKGCIRLSNENVSELVQRLYKDQYVLIRE